MPNKTERRDWNARYRDGYTAFVEHSRQKVWTSADKIPPLDAEGCSGIVILHFKFMDNPVGMSTPDHSEPGFFHAQAGPHGSYYTFESRRGPASVLFVLPDGWKRCDRPEETWKANLAEARKRIEAGDWCF